MCNAYKFTANIFLIGTWTDFICLESAEVLADQTGDIFIMFLKIDERFTQG